ncbi:MAG: type IV toxin-antitoxin system AbiEi family antitoxin [Candidatus Cloacimonetes bacterium]|nr:type IV toxin-antitoxin system AbiEi family antitoxin [Candidatus Cloacimonadota bacterium]MBS3768035.1 type IV toxin-antitoxin system AbiEi family antitoxin [Candidatus Cloacimonadota bacterium]
MSKENRTKLNELISNWPKGTIGTTNFLKKYNVGYELIQRYKKSNWLETVGNKAYKLSGDEIDWYGAIFAIQKQLNLSIHPGGKTALQLLGYAHYLSDSIKDIFLYGYRGEKLPTWYKKNLWKVATHYSAFKLFPRDTVIGFTRYSHKNFKIKISSAERAMLEMLYHFPKYNSFDDCYQIMENLVTLRSNVCQNLLEVCNSIKVKRLFLFMAEKSNHSWFDDLAVNEINLGKGKRSLVANGILDNKYKITVPKKYR